LSPHVAELLAKVRARMASAPTSEQIRDLSATLLAEPGRDPLTLAEIRQLTDVAVGRAREVELCAARLAKLTEGRQ
jgi:hypothetical protein